MNGEIDNLTIDETIDAIDALIQKKAYVVTSNTDRIVQLEKNKDLIFGMPSIRLKSTTR